VEITPELEVEQSKMYPFEVKPHIELLEEAIKTTNSEVGT
jgi:hypothetical protein